ncbi:hypothetical protein OC846_001097 [Tilletia horrida]|uniref:Cation-transporting ATPase n=1 Tax=Tilletia horrida TaxID=155126 RepID=A0AAN6GVV3_9BASI|nr:hypothetical protein OC845_002280 [Tilletia horrida]KAK0556530.1 hypothetical protein OC846_001097 [Tilletia horrida]KAK0569328.1 hypothetical protein OC861_001042 [Tilletia horrida]
MADPPTSSGSVAASGSSGGREGKITKLTSSSSKQQLPSHDRAADEFQAPFTLPSKGSSKTNNIPQNGRQDDEDRVPMSPYFDPSESREAYEWAKSHHEELPQDDNFALDLASEDGEQGVDIDSAKAVPIKSRGRRDSQVGSYDDASGSIFDGPTAGAVPSSVSSMRHVLSRPELSARISSSRSRRRISREIGRERRLSSSTNRSRTSLPDDDADDDDYEDQEVGPSRSRRRAASGAQEADEENDQMLYGDGGESEVSRPNSIRSSSYNRRRRISTDTNDETQPRSMLNSILASFRGGRADDQDDDAKSRTSARPSLGGRRRSTASSINSRRRRRPSDWSRQEEDALLRDEEYDEDFDDSANRSLDDDSISDEDGGSGRGGILPSVFGTLSGAVDPVFGDTRITTEHEPEDELDLELAGMADEGDSADLRDGAGAIDDEEQGDEALATRAAAAERTAALSTFPSAGGDNDMTQVAKLKNDATYLDKSSRSRQQVYLSDEDALVRFTGYIEVTSKRFLYLCACFLSLGIVYLLARWLPRLRLKWVCKETSFAEADFVLVENQFGDLHVERLGSVPFERPAATVFPPSSIEPAATQAEFQAQLASATAAATARSSKNASRAASVHSAAFPSTPLAPSATGNGVAFPNGSAGNGKAGQAGGDNQPISEAIPEGVAAAATATTGPDSDFLTTVTFFDYRYTRFVLHPPSGRLRMMKDWRDPKWTSVSEVASGVSTQDEHDRSILFGANAVDIAARSTWDLLVDEVLHPFYMFQIVSIILWSFDDYYYYAFCILVISAVSITTTLIETKQTVARMREMSRFECEVRVWREGRWTMMSSEKLVPGDIYDVAESGLLLFPADSVLLSGDAIVNESMLTGESVPVSKIPIDDNGIQLLQGRGSDISRDLAKHFLFSGTRIIRIRPSGGLVPPNAPTHGGLDAETEEVGAMALVVRTGFDTTKGALVRSMLFPKPMGFKFYRDSFRFIGFLGGIAAIGFISSSFRFVELGIAWHTIVIRALDLITVVVPPALPATMSIGTTFAIARLRKAGVFCISPNRVNIGGKVNVFCFDKTGTLTADGLDILGARTIDLRSGRFRELHEAVDEMPVDTAATRNDPEARKLPLLYALATCHSLKIVDGEVIGDPLDIKMFEFTGWTLDEGQDRSARASSQTGTAKYGKSNVSDRTPALVQTVVRPPGGQAFEVEDAIKAGRHAHFLELGVLRTFEFVSSLRRMSVIVKRLRSESMEVFVKGAPEVMADICDKASFPEDYDDLLTYYTKHGYRVIACAGKTMAGMSWIKAQRLRREQAESGLRFLGLIIFENKLKEGTTPAITTLRQADIICKMVTGDNPQTAVSVARECGMVGQSAHVFMPTFIQGSSRHPRAVIEWTSLDDDRVRLDPYTLKPQESDPHVMDVAELDFQDYQLALTGDIFRWMIDFAPLETLRRMLIKGTIFARMSPDEKHELVERLQVLGYTVGMCGDGANDCGALKAADIGISLSEAEASVAAPFTSRIPDITCVIEVIKEGRAALVTSFSCFKYMALYSLIQFTSITILYNLASSLGDFQFLYIDLFIILPVAVAMARTLPYPDIHPKRPTANLVSKKVLTSMLGQVVICAAAQLFTFLYTRAQPWYEQPILNPDELNVINPENSALFLVSSFQYILVAGVFSVGPPYRKPMYTNPLLMLSLAILTSFSLYVLFIPSGFFFEILGLVSFPRSFHVALFIIVLVNAAACIVFESFAIDPVTAFLKGLQRLWRRRHSRSASRRANAGKVYKRVAEDMQHDGDA